MIGKKRPSGMTDKIDINMTPMIDIVFQLLTFFLMTLKIVANEGDFNIRMPLAAPRDGMPDEQVVPMKVRITADSTGNVATVTVNGRRIAGIDALQAEAEQYMGTLSSESAEVELAADYHLRYENIIAAVSRVAGKRTKDDQIIKMIEKIKFAPPTKKPGS